MTEEIERIIRRLEQKTEEAGALKLKLDLLRRADELARSTLDVNEIIDGFTLLCMEATGSSRGSVLLLDREALVGVERREGQEVKSRSLEMGRGIGGWVAEKGVAVLTSDILKGSDLRREMDSEFGADTRAVLCVPIDLRGEVRGVVELADKEEGDYSQDDLSITALLAANLARAVETSELRTKVADRLARISTLTEASLLFSSTLDLPKLLNLVIDKAREVMEAEAGAFFQIDEAEKEIYFIAVTGEKGEAAKKVRIPWGKGIVGWVAQTGETLLVPDVTREPRFYEGVDLVTKFVTRSILAVPLKVKGKVIGVAEVLNKKGPMGFGEDDTKLFEALGRQAAVAVDNARLYRELEDLFLSSVRAIISAVEAKDHYTRGHTERVTEYSILIAKEMGLSAEEVRKVEFAALLHDVGKIGIPDEILAKPGKLTAEEFEEMKQHPVRGAEIMSPIRALKEVITGILHHHEHYGGSGYPDGLKGEEIPLMGRIIAIADAFDAMTTERPYRRKVSPEEALQELERWAARQFDPGIVKVSCKALRKHGPSGKV